MKFLFLITCPFLFLACAGSNPEAEEEALPEPISEEAEAPPEEPVEEIDKIDFVAPDTTGTLLQEENKKTVTGPAPVVVPEPAPDSAIDIKPSIPEGE